MGSGCSLNPAAFTTPAVRHLAWMLSAPQLLDDPRCLDLGQYITPEVVATLHCWDQDVEKRPAALVEPPPRRLGLYFEQLYAVLMADLLGWSILGRNLAVHDGGRTLGELDILLRNPASGAVEHHEIAVKFYLGIYDRAREAPLWYGPDTRDRLDIKTGRMLDHQCRMIERAETRALLDTLGVGKAVTAHAFMPGYLFYPLHGQLAAPSTVAEKHLRGYWLPSSELCSISTRSWVPLDKPHWLGPWVQPDAPSSQPLEQVLEWVESRGYPRLFAALKPLPDGSGWVERSRYFVVPEFWPGFDPT